MNTSAGYYQAPRPPRVPLDEVLIKLHPEGFHQEFEADGINVGAGGISMRASMLPEVGSSLRCQLDNPVGGEAIEMIGRVVWAHEKGPHAGEFGIRFTHLSEDDQLRIEALIQRWGRASATAPTVRLRLDGVGSAIVAEVQSEDHSELRVEQPLPFLAIGSAVLNETSSRRGHLESIELKMDERIPKLVLNIGYEVGDAPASPDDDGEHRDTLPDEIPPAVATPQRREARLHDAPRIVRYDRVAESASKQTSLDRVRAYAKVATDQLASSVGSAQMAVTRGLAPRITTNARELVALVGRFVAALRSRLDEKPRRKQIPRSEAARAHLKNTRRDRRRYLIVAAMAAGIVLAGWMVYVWAASGSEEAVAETASATMMAPDTASEPSAASEPGTSGEAEASRSRRHDALAAEAAVEDDRAEEAPAPPQRIHGKAFGADAVAGGVKHVLRMNNPVSQMDGIIEENGFSVTIPRSLSLSRAGPIAAAHPDVEHASILNRRDSSELTIRFVEGRKPEYRVEARGATIEITLAR
jgi:hypothetical protein